MAYNKTTWVNGVTKVNQGNLNNLEDGTKTNDDKLVNTFSADINAYFGNTKLSDDFQDESLWTIAAGTQSNDNVNVKIGVNSFKLLENNATAGFLASNKNGIDLNFSTLNNGESSDENDYISLIVYISDISAIDVASIGIQLALSQDTPYTSVNRKKINIISGLLTGWNFLKIKKSDFITDGSGDWDNIQSLQISWQSNAGFQNEFISFQLIQLIKKDPLSLIPNPFQRFGVRDFTINNGEFFVGKEFGSTVWKELSLNGIFLDSLQTQNTFNDFISIVERTQTSTDNLLYGVVAFKDATNNIRMFILSDNFELTIKESNIDTVFSIPFPIDANDKLTFKLEKNDENIAASVYKNNDLSTLVQINVISILNELFLTIGRRTGITNDIISSASITEISHTHHSDISENTKDSRINDLIQSHTNIEWLGGTW